MGHILLMLLLELRALNDADGNDYDCCYYVRKLKRDLSIHIHAKTITRLLNLIPKSHSLDAPYDVCYRACMCFSLSLCVCKCVFMNALLCWERWIRHNRLAIGQFGRIWNVNFCKTSFCHVLIFRKNRTHNIAMFASFCYLLLISHKCESK